jgi:hypothetical protein
MTMKIELTQEHLNVIAAGLQELAYKHAAPVIAHIAKQIEAQKVPQTSSVDFSHDQPG